MLVKDPVEPKVSFVKNASEGHRRDESKLWKMLVKDPVEPKANFVKKANEGPQRDENKFCEKL